MPIYFLLTAASHLRPNGAILLSGVGIVLITVSGIAWRLTSQDGPSCRAMLGLASYQDYGDGRFLSRPGYPGAQWEPPTRTPG